VKKVNLNLISGIFIWLCTYGIFSPFVAAAQEDLKPKSPPVDNLIHQAPDTVFLKIKQALKEALKKEDFISAALCDQQIGELFYYQGAYSQAISYYYKADKIFRQENDRTNLAKNLHKIGETYYYARQYKVSLEKFQEALQLYQHNPATAMG
jgi:tetratricopeptide (TPR) repeat protein